MSHGVKLWNVAKKSNTNKVPIHFLINIITYEYKCIILSLKSEKSFAPLGLKN